MTRQHGFDRYACPNVDPPTLSGPIANLGDDAERLVTRYRRHRSAQHTFELLVVAAADTARLEFQ